MHDDYSPTPEFERKVRAAAAAPSADPEFVARLGAQLHTQVSAALKTNQQSPKQPHRPLDGLAFRGKGIRTMRTRTIIPAMLAVITIALVVFFAFNAPTSVSAQEILDRASAAQSVAAAARGIWHTRIEIYQNMQALTGDNAGITTVVDTYQDMASGHYRVVTENAAGEIIDAFGADDSFTYSAQDAGKDGLLIHRTPINEDGKRKAASGGQGFDTSAFFDQFRSNPRVRLDDRAVMLNGQRVYTLIIDNYQTEKALDGRETQTYTGYMKAVFNAENYHLIDSETAIYKGDVVIVIDAARWLADEFVPADSNVAWDLSDIKGATVVDEEPTPESDDVQFGTLSRRELAQHTAQGYVLNTIPAGFTEEIVAVTDQPEDQEYAYEVHYDSAAGQSFSLQAIGQLDLGFVQANFYDGSYKTADGRALYYSISSGEGHTSAILGMPDGASFLLFSTMTREEVQKLVEDLVLAQ